MAFKVLFQIIKPKGDICCLPILIGGMYPGNDSPVIGDCYKNILLVGQGIEHGGISFWSHSEEGLLHFAFGIHWPAGSFGFFPGLASAHQ